MSVGLGVSNSVLRDIVSSYDAAGQLRSLSDLDSAYAFTYDDLGRLKSVDNNNNNYIPGIARVVLTYGYDSNGNVRLVEDAINGQAAGTTSYTYDWLNRVSQITQSGTGVQNKRVNFAYNSVGQMQLLKRYSDLGGAQLVAQTGYSYDSLNRLSQINHQNAGGGSLAFYRFGYDAAGRIQQTVDVDGTTDFTYDKTSQLTGADRAGTARDESYAYDANGNRTNAGYSTLADNRLQSDGVYNYAYDNEGNLTTRTRIGTSEVRTFTWDYRNRLTEVKDNSSITAAFTYDGRNQRISKSVGGGTTTRFVYDRGNVALEFTGSAIPSVRYLHGPMVDQVLAQEKGQQTSWMLTDQLGSVRDLVSNAGAVVGHFTYDSFGQVVSATGAVDSRYKFTGRELDSETGLYYYRARYYDARVGRFIGQDPIGFRAGDSNLYRYVGNNPLSATDPFGLAALKFGRLLFEQKRSILYEKLQPGGNTDTFRTGNITQVPIDGTAWIHEDWTLATIFPADKEYAERLRSESLPTPHGGKRDTDQKGHIIGHALGGPDDKTNNFFAQDGGSNKQFYYQFERQVRKAISEPCVLFAKYAVELQYPKGFQSYNPPDELPLRPTHIMAFAIMYDLRDHIVGTVAMPPVENP